MLGVAHFGGATPSLRQPTPEGARGCLEQCAAQIRLVLWHSEPLRQKGSRFQGFGGRLLSPVEHTPTHELCSVMGLPGKPDHDRRRSRENTTGTAICARLRNTARAMWSTRTGSGSGTSYFADDCRKIG